MTHCPMPESTAEVGIPPRLIDQVVGQEKAAEVVRLAARQRRFLLIVGEPGTGKSLLGQAVAELLPTEGLEDIIARHNSGDPMLPKLTPVRAGEGERLHAAALADSSRKRASELFVLWSALLALGALGIYISVKESSALYALGAAVVAFALYSRRTMLSGASRCAIPRILVNNANRNAAPFVDATGAQAGALLGDVRHDPYQSGGSETPPHELLEAGAIHRAHRGVLFIDEVSTLSMESQQSLLSAIQDREFPITGRSPGSSGTMVRSTPAPCDFLLVLAGNVEDIEKMHPALRSRIRGYGYEIFTQSVIADTPANCLSLIQFVAQEVRRDGKIPHFSRGGIEAILNEARRRAIAAEVTENSENGKTKIPVSASPEAKQAGLSARFRELGGLIRIAGDLAVQDGSKLVQADHVERAKALARTLEEQRKAAEAKGQRSDATKLALVTGP